MHQRMVKGTYFLCIPINILKQLFSTLTNSHRHNFLQNILQSLTIN